MLYLGGVAGDFNADGAPDLAVAIHNGTVAILLNAVARGGPAPPGAARQPVQPRPALADFFGMDFLVPAEDRLVGASAVSPPVSLTGNAFARYHNTASLAPEIPHVDRFFALLGQEERGLTDFRWRPQRMGTAQPGLSAVDVEELTVFRTEAEELV
jgi:hypothetical protein